ncbi:MAG TPA: SPOR domain-containing protein [Gallionellaceae bacterium]|nr:SPOR domain-containing protein [Gallionellaceae bacterium]
MKWLFGFLLLLSILLFALMQWGEVLTEATKNGQTLAELNPEKIRLLDKPAARQMPASAALPAQPGVASPAPVVPASAPVAANVPVPPAASAPLPVSAPAKKIVFALPVIPPPLPAPVLARVPAIVPAAQAKTAARACMEWGEFSGADLTHSANSLATLKLGDHLTHRTVEYASGYWVYMPPLKNKAAVNRKVAQIKALGVKEFYVVHEPPKLVNVISLGVFKTSEAARNFLASLQKKGVRTAMVGERKRKLKFTVYQLRNLDAEAVAHLSTLQKEFAYSELKTVACNK